MKKTLFLSIMILYVSNAIGLNQNSNEKAPKLSRNVWEFTYHNFENELVTFSIGITHVHYPLIRDANLREVELNSNYRLKYPLLILNNVVIRDKQQIDYFRNHIDFGHIKRISHIHQKRAEKDGILNVPQDGALFVMTKRGYYVDLGTIRDADSLQLPKWNVIERAYLLVDDETVCADKQFRIKYSFTYPLLVLKDGVIRDEQLINLFRNRTSRFIDINNTKHLTKEKAEKIGIQRVPSDGVLFVNATFQDCFSFLNADSLRFTQPFDKRIADTIFPQETAIIISSSHNAIYPSVSDNAYYHTRVLGKSLYLIHPLLVLNNILIRDEQQVRCFRNRKTYDMGKRIKCISKEKAEQMGIPNVPKDGVYFITTKKGFNIDLACD